MSSFAHPAPFSYLDFELRDDAATGAVVIHDFDAAHELGLEVPQLLLDAEVAARNRETLTRLLQSRMRLRADGQDVQPIWQSMEVMPARQSLRFAFTLAEPIHGALEFDVLMFPYDPKHQSFVNIYENGELKFQAILDANRTATRFYRGSAQGRWAVVETFIQAGVHHILIGFDHVLFLIGLMLLGGTWWRLAGIVTAFTLGHSVTLSLAVLGIVHIPPTIIEPIIALSIVVVGVDNLLVQWQRTAHAAPARDFRPWLAAVFGLIHGFGFASVLAEFGLSREAVGWSLAAFNIGVELGQLAIVLITLLLGTIATRVLARISPANGTLIRERFLTYASFAVIAAGVYWLAQRMGG